MKEILTGVYNKATGTTFSTSLNGRFYRLFVPEKAEYPYCVFLIPEGGASVEKAFGGKNIEYVTVQFHIFSSSSSSGEIEDIYKNLISLYDNCELTISGKTHIMMWRLSSHIEIERITSPQGTTDIYHYIIEYRTVTQ